jgi:hypothetical protein
MTDWLCYLVVRKAIHFSFFFAGVKELKRLCLDLLNYLFQVRSEHDNLTGFNVYNLVAIL